VTGGAPRRPVLVVGLTGGIGSGKSTVAARFAALGVPVIDADRVAREVVEPGQPALGEVAQAFGGGVLGADGALDRAALRARVFADPRERRRLEAIVHPRVRERLRAGLARLEAPYAVVEIQLLIESGQRDLVDRVLVVEASEPVRVARATARDGTDPAQVRQIVAAQASAEQRRAAAHDVITNEGTLEALEAAVRALHERYRELAAARTEADLPRGARE